MGNFGTNDFMANVPSGYRINAETVQVFSETGFSSETGSWGGFTYGNRYTVQINTNWFPTTVQGISGQGAVQFIFEEQGCPPWGFGYCYNGDIYLEYWLTPSIYITNCPSGWNIFTTSTGWNDCYYNAPGTGTNYEKPNYLTSYAWAAGISGNNLYVQFCDYNSNSCWTNQYTDVLSLGSLYNWTSAETNVFGDCCNTAATFNSGFTLTWNLDMFTSGSRIGYLRQSMTGETNNLNLQGTPTINFPYFAFTEGD
ncbi:MAG TPA: hypothetical protein VGR53_03370 [Nitrososphaerales archaeon]|nr:hypothetical protein [Nitrososphaerales archaeon]